MSGFCSMFSQLPRHVNVSVMILENDVREGSRVMLPLVTQPVVSIIIPTCERLAEWAYCVRVITASDCELDTFDDQDVDAGSFVPPDEVVNRFRRELELMGYPLSVATLPGGLLLTALVGLSQCASAAGVLTE